MTANVRRRLWLGAAVLTMAACAHNNTSDDVDEEPSRDPIKVHVRNENFLDVNVYAYATGISRRLGQVPGNGSGDFTIAYNVVNGQQVQITATQIGGNERYVSPPLTVGSEQMIDVRIAPIMRQSASVVRQP